jgi:hypothetical protein
VEVLFAPQTCLFAAVSADQFDIKVQKSLVLPTLSENCGIQVRHTAIVVDQEPIAPERGTRVDGARDRHDRSQRDQRCYETARFLHFRSPKDQSHPYLS